MPEPKTDPAPKARPRCEPGKPDANAVDGHAYSDFIPTASPYPGNPGKEDLNRCRICGRVSEYQKTDQMAEAARAKGVKNARVAALILSLSAALIMMAVSGILGIGMLPLIPLAFRDREINFIPIVSAAVADTADGETSIDLSNYGVQMANGKALRIFKIEIDFAIAQRWLGSSAADVYLDVAVRTITSGSTPPTITDDGVIGRVHLDSDFVTGVGILNSFPAPIPLAIFPEGLLIASDRLYLYVNNESDQTITVRARVWAKLEDVEEGMWKELWEVWRRA